MASAKRRRKGISPFIEEDAQALYNQLFELEKRARHSAAPNPVSLEKFHLKDIGRTHLVGEKNDGVRCLLLFGRTDDEQEQNYVVKVYRNRKLSSIDCDVRDRQISARLGSHDMELSLFDGTLLDGEWVEATGELILFDAVAIGGYDMKRKKLQPRLSALREIVKNIPELPFQVRCKKFLPVSEASTVYESHDNIDGLIFMPLDDVIRTGRHEKMYKYKLLEHCTLDLQWSGKEWFAIGDAGRRVTKIPFLTPRPEKNRSFVKDAIYELAPSFEADQPWKIVRRRMDKLVPNHMMTVVRTMKSIRDNISLSDILDHSAAGTTSCCSAPSSCSSHHH